MNLNAGHRLIAAQKAQRTLLCCGVDPHYDPSVGIDGDMYGQYATEELIERIGKVVSASIDAGIVRLRDERATVRFLAGVAGYFRTLFRAAYRAGIRVYKPQSAFFERFDPFGRMIELLVLEEIYECANASGETDKLFVASDCKREDLALTMRAYYDARLMDGQTEIIPGMCGQFKYDTMTVTFSMGEDVLAPGLDFFRSGKGAIVVTRSSNVSGTTLQDLVVSNNPWVQLSSKQEPFRLTGLTIDEITAFVGHPPMYHEVVLYLTEQFATKNNLIENGVSPLFSVMGATVKMDNAFRRIRPSGTALIPGFGGQKGNHANVMSLFWSDGPHAGFGGMCASSRENDYAWMKQYGGDDDPDPAKFAGHVERSIERYRAQERKAFEDAGSYYPFSS